MKNKIKKWIRPALFTLGGALLGLGYYAFVGCSTGSCAITSNPLSFYTLYGTNGLAALRCNRKGV